MSELEPTKGTGSVPAPGAHDRPTDRGAQDVDGDAVVDLLVEEVSIDGMCGVY